MKVKYLIAASAVALIAGGSAQAADVVVAHTEAPAVAASAFSWQGFYAGGEIGGSWAQSKLKSRGNNQTYGSKVKPDGFIGGLYAGYNFEINGGDNIVLGAETDFLWNDVDDIGSKELGGFKYKTRVKQKWVGSTRLRAGYAVDRWLPYVAAGVAYGKIDTRLNRYDADDAFVSGGNKNKTRSGWTIGAGVDYAMTDNVLLRVEYRYTDFGKKTYDYGNEGSYRIKYNSNDVRVGVAYKF